MDADSFLGHGGAEQFVRSQSLARLPRCAVAMLWGCSSGRIERDGEYGCSGTPMDYLAGSSCVPVALLRASAAEDRFGSAAVVANLWDVTDKDIDRCTMATLTAWQLIGPTSASSTPGPGLATALAQGREACSLRYLNGAAAVMYGWPVRL